MDALTETVTRLDGGGTLRVDSRGCEEWRDARGQLHRDGGPALKHDGFEAWYVHGLRHRVEGPAVSWASNGAFAWWLNGHRHRADGPALRDADGHEEWWVDGQRVIPAGTPLRRVA